ncbi:MAG TPA: YihY/virulence factor BrkB family protein [Candidatus Sulfotelmatobacter sp.]|nr:YihY/virulence factor BrkB family protein [Candidatus Sulfotelmatobacter sp.]
MDRTSMAGDSVLSTDQQIDSLWALGGLTWRQLFERVWGGINRNDLINRAYELAYNFLLAVFPMLLFMLGLFGIFASEGGKLRTDLFYYFQLVLPPAAYDLLTKTVREVTPSTTGGKLTFGLLFALYSGSSGMTQLMSTLNAAYEVRESRSWLRIHLVSLALTLAMSILVIAALFVVLAGGQVLASMGMDAGMSHPAFVAIKIVQWVFALVFVVFAFAVIYYFAPNVKAQHWYWLTPGSVFGVVLWALASGVLRAYLHFFNSYSKTYGSLGAVIILMLWFYVTGLSFLIGSQINATIEHAAAEHGHVEAKAPGEKASPADKVKGKDKAA